MNEIIGSIERWRAAGKRVALARVVGLEGSGPRDPGAAMAVNEDGEVAGSVSGGCVEGAVVTAALEALSQGTPRRCSFGYSDADAFAVGLTCGGTVHLLVDPRLPPPWPSLVEAIGAERPVALATVVDLDGEGIADGGRGSSGAAPSLGSSLLVYDDGRFEGSLGNPELDAVVSRDATGALAGGLSETRHYGACGEARRRAVEVFIEVFAAPPHMVIFGAVDFTAALARVAKTLGYRVTVCDARAVFAAPARFPMADEVVVDRPERYLDKVGPSLSERDAVCVLTHDAKFDDPAIIGALATRVGYLGAMGSARTNRERAARLREAGVGEEGLRRLMAPIGLDIGARTPEETAVAICAEIIALRTGRPAPSLRDKPGRIHEAPAAARRAAPAAAGDGAAP
jgi:xanthine dehydrogenase accessory factor